VAYDYRWPVANAGGTLTSAIAASDTSISSSAFGVLPTLAIGQNFAYCPIVLIDPLANALEIVWVIVHAAGTTTVTAQRGKEGTTARAWAANTQWLCGPTTRDTIFYTASGQVPADMHVGAAALYSDKGDYRIKTLNQGFLGPTYQSFEDMGRALDNTTGHPAGSVPQRKTWNALNVTTDASGDLSVTIPNGGFPTRLIGCQMARIFTTNATPVFWPCLNTTSTKTTINLRAQGPTTVVASTSISVSFDAVGY